ncbi:extracellular solute-binding protein [Cryobacterium sp. TMS1-20-1]|uniref:ABC transporter substrate-binding protein n=1 Tax=Cryobacterium sp. TMS1-20-1 TaxID=1259223 RepID=UPI00106DC877|nr:extracellular solute-binding protein [Cryobacterium sp. TMS1-20-1]TFC77258.1 extracellular solute-binding protein [Cryobacterium sp. TMS1-20-1]
MNMNRKQILASSVAVALLLGLAGCAGGGGSAPAAAPAGELEMPSEPVTLNLVDVSGDVVVAQPMIEAYMEEYPQYLAKVNFDTGDATEIAGKLQAQQAAGVSQIDMVLTGNDALGAGIELDLWQKLLPDYDEQLGESVATYQPNAQKMLELADGYAVVNDYGNYGPLLEYLPQTVSDVPTTADELMAWAKANPGQFMYARPANSGPGRAFVQGLPYILGDTDPMDPIDGWDKTWAYLAELGQYIDYYPSGTGATMRELADGSRSIIASSAGWDLNPRAIGTVPAEADVAALDGTSWVMDSNFIAVPKGISEEKLAVVLDLMKWMLTPEQQAKAYDTGYMYPGPAVEGVTLGMAPQESQDVVNEFGREKYDALLEAYPVVTPVDNKALGAMFDKWDREIGAGMIQE